MDSEKRNLIMALVGSLLVLAGYYYFYEKPRIETEKEQVLKSIQAASVTPNLTQSVEMGNFLQKTIQNNLTPAQALRKSPRITINTPKIQGSLSLVGARFDSINLKDYKETTSPSSPPVTLLVPSQTQQAYYAEFGWISNDSSIQTPNSQTVWECNQSELTSKEPLVLYWTNPQGLLFKKTIEVDDNYLFTITESIYNPTTNAYNFSSYGLISRRNPEVSSITYALHEGTVGYLNGKLQEVKYKDLDDDKNITFDSSKGWMGFTDKYWLTALLPSQNKELTGHFRALETPNSSDSSNTLYQIDFMTPLMEVKSHETIQETFHFFAGAKSVPLLDMYEKQLNIPHFDLAVDFGWFYFITKPLFFVLNWLHGFFGNFGLAILALTFLMRAALFPLANKSFKSMARMKEYQPQLAKLKEECGDDKIRYNQAMMELYKKNKLNPVSGCLPMVIQIPILFAIYKVLLISIEMRHAPFYGWIHDLSAADPTTLFNLFGLIPWAPPSILMIGALPVLMGVTMFLQQKLSPQSADPIQSKMFLVMPFLFTYMLAQFPAGLVLYWTFTNILSILQQVIMTRTSQKKMVNHQNTSFAYEKKGRIIEGKISKTGSSSSDKNKKK